MVNRTEEDDIRCFVKHGDRRCAACNRGLLAWLRRRAAL